MSSKTKSWVGNAASKSQVWAYSPPVTSTARNWALTVNGKTIAVVSNGTPANAATLMQAAWSASQEPEFQEITASVPASGSIQTNPQGTGTNKINSIAITGSPTGGSFGLAWAGAVATFLHDPTAAPTVADSNVAGNPNGVYRYTYTLVAMNPLGQLGETKVSPEATVTVTSHGVLVTVPTGPAGTIARKIYRTLAGGVTGTEQLVWELFDNTTTEFFDNIADGSLGAAPPSGNTTGIPYNATAQQIQNVLQNLNTIGPGEAVCAGSGTVDDPWVAQFVNDLGAQPQPDIVCVGWSFVWPTTVPAQTIPQVVVTEIQPGVVAFDLPPADGAHLVLTGAPGVPFYIEQSVVSGTLTPEVDIKTVGNATSTTSKSSVTVTREAATIPAIAITPIAPTITAVRTVQGAPAINEIQRLTIGPNAQSGPGVTSTFELAWDGQATSDIPIPPQPCVASLNATAGNLNSATGYVWAVTFVTQYGETEPSQPTSILKIANQQANITSIPTGASVVTSKKLYRAKIDAQGNIGPYQYLAPLDSTSTTYNDNTADASLGAEIAPTTNFALQGALEALSNTGQGTIKVSVASHPAWSGHYNGQPITYDVEFEGALGGASQDLITGNVSGIIILPRIAVTEVRRGSTPANTIQQFGWKQVLGYGLPSGTFTLTIPSLNITTGAIAANASAGAVLAAIQAVAPSAYQKAFAVTSVQSTNFGYLWQIEFGDVLAQTDVPPIVLNVAGMTAQQIPVPDTLTGTVSTVIHGSITGEDEMFTVSLEDGATGGTLALAVSSADGTLLGTASGIAYNATASSVQTALTTALSGATATVTGNAGGPWTIEFVGDLGAQQLLLTATSSLVLSGDVSGSPPGSNTTGDTARTDLSVSATITGSALSSGTYYYVVTASNDLGETTASNEVSVTVTSDSATQAVFIQCPQGFNNIYRGTSAGAENICIARGLGLIESFFDNGTSPSSASPPASNTAGISVPAGLNGTFHADNQQGLLSAGTYYYVVTAISGSGETTPSSEVSGSVADLGLVSLGWSSVAGATGYKIYRGTASGAESTLLATISPNIRTYEDQGNVPAAGSPPGTNGTLTPAPVQADLSASTSGGTLASATYYYEITAITVNGGETTASNEKSISVTGPSGSVTISWTEATTHYVIGYKIYRGTSAGSENVLVATIFDSSATTFTDTGNPATFSATELVRGSPAINEAWTITQQYAIGGTYSIGFNGVATAALAYNAAAATIQTAMQGLVTIGPNNCAVSSSSPSNGITQIIVTFQGALGGLPMPNVTVTNQLVGTTAYDVLLTNALGGTFTLNVGGAITGDISTTTSAATLQADLVALPTVGTGKVTVTAGTSPSEWIVSFDTSIAGVGRPIGNVAAVTGSITDLITYTGPASGTFSLSINNRRTSQLSGTASASDVQAALEQILPSATVAVTGSAGGPWTATVTAVLSGLGSDIADGLGVGISLGFVVSLKNVVSGTFTLTSVSGTDAETSLGIAYNATPAQLTTAILGMAQFASATVTGQTGGPWTITITPQNADTPPTLTGNTVLLVGPSGSFDGYPTIYAFAIGPNFFDAPGNWTDGSMPSAYLPTPPNVLAVIPTSGGTLALGDTFYYKVTAINANGETTGGTEGSGQTVSPVTVVINGATGGTFTLSYGGQTTSALAYNAPATGTGSVQTAMQALSSVGAGNCTITGSGTSASPFEFVFSGAALTNGRPAALTANATSLTPAPGSSISITSDVQQSFTLTWTQTPNATGYKVYRGTSAGSENVLLATFDSPDQTVFVDDGTYTTTSASPPTNANAWNTAVGDSVYLNNSTVDCLYNIEHSIVNGYSIHGSNGTDPYRGLNYFSVAALTADASFTGRVALSVFNPAGYEEYRPTKLSIVGPPSGVFPIAIGSGSGNGSSLISLDTGTCQVSGVINKTAGATIDPAALLWIGSNSASEWSLFFGSMGIAIYPGQVFELATIRQAYQTNVANDTTLEIGAGGSVPTLSKAGGDTLLHGNVTTLSAKGGTVTQDGGTITTLDLEDATYYSKSTGEITALKVTNDGVFDRSQDSRPLQIGSVNLYAGASYLDPHGATYTSAPGQLSINLVECGLQPQDPTGAIVDLGRNTTLVRTQN